MKEMKFYLSNDAQDMIITEEGKVCEFDTAENAKRFLQECIDHNFITEEEIISNNIRVVNWIFFSDYGFENCEHLHAWEV